MANARTTDPATSHEAAASVSDITLTQKRVLTLLRSLNGATDERLVVEFQARYGHAAASPSGIRSRRAELALMGKVTTASHDGKTASGRRARQWVAVA